ncbi:unnamed protein product, partial [Nesidiocoris tenuis]
MDRINWTSAAMKNIRMSRRKWASYRSSFLALENLKVELKKQSNFQYKDFGPSNFFEIPHRLSKCRDRNRDNRPDPDLNYPPPAPSLLADRVRAGAGRRRFSQGTTDTSGIVDQADGDVTLSNGTQSILDPDPWRSPTILGTYLLQLFELYFLYREDALCWSDRIIILEDAHLGTERCVSGTGISDTAEQVLVVVSELVISMLARQCWSVIVGQQS